MEAQTRIHPASEGAVETIRVLMPSPIGSLGVEVLGTAVIRLTIEPAEAERPSFMHLHDLDGSDFLDELFGRLAEYFAGARRKLDIDFDLTVSGLSLFARRVLKEAAKVPYGRTRTCREIAEASGRPESFQEVLAALCENPIPVVIPCHRVLDADGGLGDYVGGPRRKRWLLDLESQDVELL